jgi:cysteine dioxygenase
MNPATKITFAELFDELDRYSGRVPVDLLVARLECLELDWTQIDPFVRFSSDTYRRNLIHAGPAYHALILCWRSGQRSPIHDHRGSSCAVRVLLGTCTETLFERAPGVHIFPTTTQQLTTGSCCGSQDADIHQISNLEATENLITLHIYSPPLLTMGQYSLTSTKRSEFVEPNYFLEGEGI